MAISDLTTSTRPTPDPAARPRGASFRGASVVQLVAGHPGEPTAAVVELHPATVTVTDRAVTAGEGELSWSWPHRDVVQVHHGSGARWSLLVVPGVAHHGVAVAAEDVDAFRAALDRHRPGAAPGPVASLASEVAFEPTPPVPVLSPAPVPAPMVVTPPAPVPEPAVPPPPPMPAAPTPVASPEPGALPGPGTDPLPGSSPVTEVIPTVIPGAIGPAPQGLAGLEARDISAWFGTHQVLDRVSLEMAAGEVTALIGPSGCGKSTFLRILNRMHELVPSAALAGEVRLDGDDIYDPSRKLTDARRQIGMVFQKPNPFPAMSIYDNVVASLKLTGTKAGLWTEVKDRLRQPGGGLSGGQQQRLCIARALAIRPRVLLMDEPCSALDPTSTRRIEQTITELVDEVTIVIVTHNMQQAARVSDRCAFFLAEHGTPGYIVEHGPTDAMFHAPQDPRTSDYVNGRFG